MIKYFIKGFLLIGLVYFFSCAENNQNIKNKASSIVADTLEDKILSSIKKLPFVESTEKTIDSITMHKQKFSYIIDTLADTLIYIKVGINNVERYETFYQFYFNPISKNLKMYEPINDSLIDITMFVEK